RGFAPVDAGDDSRYEGRAYVTAAPTTMSMLTNPTGVSHSPSLPADPELELLIPEGDVENPEFSIVIPALNEQLTMADFISWCHEGMRKASVVGEILIVDSSKDRTAEIALAGGARVLKAPKRGLGR